MRALSKIVFAIVTIAIAPAAFAQGTGTTGIVVEEPWARATPSGAQTGAIYMTIDNKTAAADRLVDAKSDVSAKVQIHQMSVVNGIMRMREVTDGLPIPADGTVTLKPGSYHVMLIGLKKPLTAGETIPVTLTFAKAGNISVTVPVRAISAADDNKAAAMGGMHGGQPGSMGNMEMK